MDGELRDGFRPKICKIEHLIGRELPNLKLLRHYNELEKESE